MKIEDFRKGIKDAKQALIDAMPQINEEIAVSTLSLVKDRSINEGILIGGKEGTKKDYSTKLISTSLFEGKELNAAGAAYIKANTKGTWGKFRKAQGRSDEKVNLSYTNRMWTGIQVIRTGSTGVGKVESVVGAVDEETKKKLAANVARYGMFLDPTPDELRISQEVANERILSIIRGR